MFFRKSSRTRNSPELPSQYEFIEVLGEGDFGKVIKCWKRDTKQMVAAKIPKKYDKKTKKEVQMLERFRSLKFDEQNIVKLIDHFDTPSGKAMVFEVLDINMDTYVKQTYNVPMLLSDVRTIIKQLATALDALKGIGVIHTDLKLDNIMMVNRQVRPFKIKLIDFSVAIPKSKARKGMSLQPLWFRAPEIMLGLPFSEAIDMWSLGIVMAKMVSGSYPFKRKCEYEVMQCIVRLLGLPARHLLRKGSMTKQFFTKTGSNNWKLKTPLNFPSPTLPCLRGQAFRSLDDLKKLRLETRNKAEAVEREQCIELLKAMLTIDPEKRITPQEILTHPFITQEKPNNNDTDIQLECHTLSATVPSGVIMVCPAPYENTLQLEDIEDEDITITQSTNCSPPLGAQLGVIMDRPTAAEHTQRDQQSAVSHQSGLNKMRNKKTLVATDSTKCDDTGKDKKKKNCFQRFFTWMRKTFRIGLDNNV